MARTRAEIVSSVVLNTGLSGKGLLMSTACDDALKVAVLRHGFRDATTTRGWNLTSAQDYISLSAADSASGTDKVLDVVTARVVDTSTDDYGYLKMKNRQWWDKNVVHGEDNQQGWPDYGMRDGDNLFFERPVEANKQVLLRCVSAPTFSADDSECPIESLDMFVERYVTARVFFSVQEMESYALWKADALRGEGGLSEAIAADPDTAEEREFEGIPTHARQDGVSVTNLTSGMATSGSTIRWY